MTSIEKTRARKRAWGKAHSLEIAARRKEKRSANLAEFNKQERERSHKRNAKDPIAARARWRLNYAKSKTIRRNQIFKKKYGITAHDYMQMFFLQGGKCAICLCPYSDSGRDGLMVDHNHSNGNVRGLLCLGCNTALGGFRESVDTLHRALNYLGCP